MKILIFSKHFYPENFKINLISEKLSIDNYVTVFSSNNALSPKNTKKFSEKKNFKYKGADVFSSSSYIKTNNNSINIFINYLHQVFSTSFTILKKRKIDFDFSITFATSPIFQCIPAIILSKIKKKPCILWVQDLWPEVLIDTGYVKNKLMLTIINFLVKQIYFSCDHIFVQSKSFKNHLSKVYNLKKIHVLYQPADYDFQKYRDFYNKGKYIITYAGNFGTAQEFDTLFEALIQNMINNNIFFQLIGSGKLFDNLKTKLNKSKIKNISLYSQKSKFEIGEYLSKSNAFFVSLKDGEALNKTLPGKLQTYICYGKPIIAVSNGALSNFIKSNKIGFSSSPNDVINLAKNINSSYLMSASDKKKIYNNSKIVYSKYFDVTKITNKILDVGKKIKC